MRNGRARRARRGDERGEIAVAARPGGTGTVPSIPGYADLEVIGYGASATVYRAMQEGYDRQVAVKVLNVDVSDRRAQRRFQRERALNGRLSDHPNVVTVLDSGFVDGRHPYLAMELFELGSLSDQLRARGPFDVAAALHVGVRIAGALETAHRLGVLHRDVKPQNVLQSRFGEPALADFGIAAILEMEHSLTAALTPVHAAPELLEGSDPSEQTDVYALASTIYTVLAGSPPFAGPPGEGMLAQLLRITTSDLPALARADVPASLLDALRRAMAKRPADRTPSAAEFGRELRRVQAELGLAVTPLPVEGAGDEGAPERAAASPPLRLVDPSPPSTPPTATAAPSPPTAAPPPAAPSPAAPSPVVSPPAASSPVAPSPAAPSPVVSSPAAPSPVVSSPVTSSPVVSSPVEIPAATSAGSPTSSGPFERVARVASSFQPPAGAPAPHPLAAAAFAPTPAAQPRQPLVAPVLPSPAPAAGGHVPMPVARTADVLDEHTVDAPTITARHVAAPAPVPVRRRRWVVPVACAAALVVGTVGVAGAVAVLGGDGGDDGAPATTTAAAVTTTAATLPADVAALAPTGLSVSTDAGDVLLRWMDATGGRAPQVVYTYPTELGVAPSPVPAGTTSLVVPGVGVDTPACFIVAAVVSIGADPSAPARTANSAPFCINGAVART